MFSPAREKMAEVIPTSAPLRSKSAPPLLLPGLMAASVWRNSRPESVHVTRFCADDTRGHGVMQTDWVANRDNPVADVHAIGITEPRGPEAGEVAHPQQRQVQLRIGERGWRPRPR